LTTRCSYRDKSTLWHHNRIVKHPGSSMQLPATTTDEHARRPNSDEAAQPPSPALSAAHGSASSPRQPRTPGCRIGMALDESSSKVSAGLAQLGALLSGLDRRIDSYRS
ncbi:MAG: hypothetical protein M3022_13415, partial [Actinomycetota bacterium]|nr:hypothetical protein [Actinomycetota bacterium]